VNLYYHFLRKGDTFVADKRARPIDAGTPRVRRIRFSEITAEDAHYAAAFLYGLPEAPIEDVSFRDIAIAMSPEAREGVPEHLDDEPPLRRAGFIARNVRGLDLKGVEVSGQSGEKFVLQDVT
jgi:hypothetical protein